MKQEKARNCHYWWYLCCPQKESKTNNNIYTVMKIFTKSVIASLCVAGFCSVPAFAATDKEDDPRAGTISDTRLECYFEPCTEAPATPDKDGFIGRWTLLEPISKPNRTNTVFTDSYLRDAFYTEYFPEQFTVVPEDGDKVKVDKQKLRWHSFDSKLYNVKLFRFASNMETDVYGVLFWAVTVINCEEDIPDVRMSVGSNSASMWWLNGEEAVLLSGDRRMVQDDCCSRRLTLKKGKNIIRGAVINGPGMSDFCIRFVDEAGNPVTNFTITNQ